ncbi:MAG TPA: linear amide C-N hydrolase [Firmicutes bacterium]|nr:linear amide C-N hydrolase [Bacillota bacterium]
MLKVTMAGSGYDMGRAHGRACKDQIITAHKELCRFDGLSETTRRRCIDLYVERLEMAFPDLVEEMRGIAEETDLELNQVIELTLWEEIKSYSGDFKVAGACTSVAFTRTLDGLIIGKTTDIETFQRPYYILQSIQPTKGYKLLSVGKVGSTKTEIGINEKGLCVATGSALPLDKGHPGIERMTLVRAVLQYCSDVDEAIAMLSSHSFIRLGLYLLLADRTGKVCVIEKSISHQGIRLPDQRGIIFATNFYVLPSMAPFMDKSAFYYQNALERYINLTVLVESGLPKQGVKGMMNLLRNHNPIGPICAHFEELGMCSYYAYIVLPEELRLLLSDGNPCQSEFCEFRI